MLEQARKSSHLLHNSAEKGSSVFISCFYFTVFYPAVPSAMNKGGATAYALFSASLHPNSNISNNRCSRITSFYICSPVEFFLKPHLTQSNCIAWQESCVVAYRAGSEGEQHQREVSSPTSHPPTCVGATFYITPPPPPTSAVLFQFCLSVLGCCCTTTPTHCLHCAPRNTWALLLCQEKGGKPPPLTYNGVLFGHGSAHWLLWPHPTQPSSTRVWVATGCS